MFTTSIKNAVVQVSDIFRTESPAPSHMNVGEARETCAPSSRSSSSAPTIVISILLVDDEPLLLDVGRLYLERTPGITVTIAGSAAEALKLFSEESFDAIVSDYQIPEMDGIAFLREVRHRSLAQPFIIFTDKGREDVVIEALNNAADYYVQKGGDPIAQYAELLHKVRRAVRQRRAEAALRKNMRSFGLFSRVPRMALRLSGTARSSG